MAGTKDILLGNIRSGAALTIGQQVKLALMLSYPAILAQLSSVMMQYIDNRRNTLWQQSATRN